MAGDLHAIAIGDRGVRVGSELTPSYGRLRICTNDSRRSEPEVGHTSRTLRDALLLTSPYQPPKGLLSERPPRLSKGRMPRLCAS